MTFPELTADDLPVPVAASEAAITPQGDERIRALREAARYAAEWIAFQRALHGVPGVQVAVRHRGELLLDVACGVADAEHGELLTTEHLFRIASHSKMFTATAVMQLVERGALRLDDPLSQWVPELAGTEIAGVTVRELLGHQAGVVRDGSDANFWQRGGGRFPDRETIVGIARDEGVVLEPNQFFKYSNIGYSLLGLVIEGASGVDYAEFVVEHITGPLGLTRTGPEWVADRAAEFAAGHTGLIGAGDVRRRIRHVDTGAMAAATGWFANAADLTAYGAAHAFGDETLVSDASKRLLQRPESTITIAGVTRQYGLGFDVRKIGGRDLVGHGGGYPGHITRTWIDPTDRLVVSVLSNAIDGPADMLATGVVEILDLALSLATETKNETPHFDGFPGRFANLWGVIDIVVLGGHLVALAPKLLEPTAFVVRLTPTAEPDVFATQRADGFWATGENATFTRGETGEVTSLTMSGVTSWPIDVWRAALESGDVAGTLPQASL